jgi:hypothetical protein
VTTPSPHTALLLLFAVRSSVAFALQPAVVALATRRERAADDAARAQGLGPELAGALARVHRGDASIGFDRRYCAVFAEAPPVRDRIAALLGSGA